MEQQNKRIQELENEIVCLKQMLQFERATSKEFKRQIEEAQKILTGTLSPTFT